MARQQRASSETSFADLLIDESPDALITLTVDGRICSWNRGATAMFDFTAEEAIGHAIDELTVPELKRKEFPIERRLGPLRPAYATKGDDETAFGAACDGYMSKPIDTDAAARLVAGHLARRVGRGK